MKRREFLSQSLTASLGLGLTGVWSSPAEAQSAQNPVLMVIFLRGAADGLSLVPPRTGSARTVYLDKRPHIAIRNPLSLGTSTSFGLHPSLRFFQTMWNNSELAIVHGAGSVNGTRSHFEQMDWIEWGHHNQAQPNGYLSRALAALNGSSAPFSVQAAAFQPAFEPSVPQSLRGGQPVQAITTLEEFSRLASSQARATASLSARVAGMNAPTSRDCGEVSPRGPAAVKACREALISDNAISVVSAAASANPAVSPVASYTVSTSTVMSFGKAMREAARLIAAQPRVRVVTLDLAGWDTHVGQGSDADGAVTWRGMDLNMAVQAFVADAKRLGFWGRFCGVVMTEFGRTVAENGTKGTDHGRGGAAFVFGPSTKIQRQVLAPSWSLTTLDAGRDLHVRVDLRDIMGEVLQRHLRVPSLASVYPGHTPRTWNLLKA